MVALSVRKGVRACVGVLVAALVVGTTALVRRLIGASQPQSPPPQPPQQVLTWPQMTYVPMFSPLPLADTPIDQLTFFVVVVSATRQSVDYAAPLLNQLVAQTPAATFANASSNSSESLVWSVNLLDVDPPEKRRPHSWFANLPPAVTVLRPSQDPLNVSLDPKLDKLGDDPSRIAWRAKESRDMRDALIYGAESGAKFVVVLEDDVVVTSEFYKRLVHIALTAESPWLGWSLIRTGQDAAIRYFHGQEMRYEACTQGMLYRAGPLLDDLIASFGEWWRELPADWIIREHQRRRSAVLRAAVPSLVDHVGVVSTLDAKNNGTQAPLPPPGGRAPRVKLCAAYDFAP